MRKSAILVGVLTFIASLFSIISPVLRQGLSVTLGRWRRVLDDSPNSQPLLRDLAERARTQHDAEGLAFAAMGMASPAEAADLAEEAVLMDPHLTWVCYVVAQRGWNTPTYQQMTARLQAWDPHNATPFLLAADGIAANYSYPPPQGKLAALKENKAWLQAVAAAFNAPTYDTYSRQQLGLERSVANRYALRDPFLLMGGLVLYPMPGMISIRAYEDYLLGVGKDFEARHSDERAAQSYWTLAAFGQHVQLNAQNDYERFVAAKLQIDAYERLQPLAARRRDFGLSDLLNHQTEALRRSQATLGVSRDFFWMQLFRWNAVEAQASALVLLFSAGLLLVFGAYVLACRWLPPTLTARWAVPFQVSGILGALGLCLSTTALYVSYRPFAEQFAEFIRGGGEPPAQPLLIFEAFSYGPRILYRLALAQVFSFYFWCVFTACAALVLGLLLHRRIRKALPAESSKLFRPPAQATGARPHP